MKKSTLILLIYLFSLNNYLAAAPLIKNTATHNQKTGLTEKLLLNIEKNKEKHLAFLQAMIRAQKDGEAAVQTVVADRFKQLGGNVETLKV